MIQLVRIAFFLVILPSICLATLTNKKIELFIAVLLPFYAVWLYLCGMINCLVLGRYAIDIGIYAVFALFVIRIFQMIRQKKGKVLLEEMKECALTPGLLIFVLGIVFSAYLSFGRGYSTNDEFSHWGRIVRVLFEYNVLPAKNEEALKIIMFKSYPLGSSLIGYLFACQYSKSVFYEFSHIFSAEIVILSLLNLFILNTKWKDFLIAFFFEISLFLCCMSLGSNFFTYVFVDMLLGITLACSIFATYILYPFRTKHAIYLSVFLAFLILIKQSGLGLAVLAMIIPSILGIKEAIGFLRKKQIRQVYRIYPYYIPLSSFAISVIHKNSLSGFQENFSGKRITLRNIYDGYVYNSNGIFQEIWDKMIDQVFFTNKPGLFFQSSYFAIILFLAIIIYFLNKKKSVILNCITFIIPIGFIVYTTTLLLYYNFSFTPYEGVRLGSFDRYLQTYMIFSILLSFAIIYSISINSNTRNRLPLFFIIAYSIISLPHFKTIKSYFKPITNSEMTVYSSIFDQIIKQYINESDKFFIISQEDKVMNGLVPALYYPKNYLWTPGVSASWGAPQYEGDMWSKNYSENQINEILDTHQYCYLHNTNQYFSEHYSQYFSSAPDKSNVLYRSLDRKLVPLPLKSFVFDFQKSSLLDTKEEKAHAKYSARKGYLDLQLMQNGTIELVPKAICPLWNGFLKKLNIEFSKIKGCFNLSIKINNVIIYDGLIDSSTEQLSFDIPNVRISKMSFNLTGNSEYSSARLNSISLLYANQSETESLSDQYAVSPFSLVSNGSFRLIDSESFSVQGKQIYINSSKPINNPIPSNGGLVLSGKIVNKGTTTPTITIGWSPLTKDLKSIRPINVQPIPGTDTILLSDLDVGSNVLYVEDASKWSINDELYLFFNTQDDYSDIPNFSNIDNGLIKVRSITKQSDNHWKIEIDNPSKQLIMKGSHLRQHKVGGIFLYSASFKLNPNEEKVFEGHIESFSKNYDYNIKNGWPKGSSYASIVILSYSGKEDIIELHDLMLSSAEDKP